MGANPNNQSNLFAAANRQVPLAEQLRPSTLDDVIGQQHLFAPGQPLRGLVDGQELVSMVLWGPPGVGKTTLARIIARHASARFVELSAVNSGLKELRQVVADAETSLNSGGSPTVLFIDEIHRYSKTQQDALLPVVENGTLIVMGATTENPSFQVIGALLSRMLVVRLQPLGAEDITQVCQRAQQFLPDVAPLSPEVTGFLARHANGDARKALGLIEIAAKCAAVSVESNKKEITAKLLEAIAQRHAVQYDQNGDAHYDHASAYQKSMRGGDADAALYWLAKMIAGGEDPRFIARRLVVTAAEDVGLARPTALVVANAAAQAVERLGLPEGRIPLATATAYVARCPKSNHAYRAIDKALGDITNGKSYPPPAHLKDAHYKDAKALYGHGEGYVYTHNNPDSPQTFLPEELLGTTYLEVPDNAAP